MKKPIKIRELDHKVLSQYYQKDGYFYCTCILKYKKPNIMNEIEKAILTELNEWDLSCSEEPTLKAELAKALKKAIVHTKLKKWKEFEEFLIRKDAFHNYYQSLTNKVSTILSNAPSDYINSAFMWISANKGNMYWNNLDKEWKKQIS